MDISNNNINQDDETGDLNDLDDFELFNITINVDAYGEAQERLTELTNYVENSCPFAKKFLLGEHRNR